MDDYRLAPILDEANIFGQHGQDILSLDLPPIQTQSFDALQDVVLTPTRVREGNPFEQQLFDASPSSGRKPQHDSHNQSTLPIAKVLNQEQGDAPKPKDAAQDIMNGPHGSIQLPQPNVQYPSDNHIPRIPPLLQGLHDPPPDAGLFPRITDDQGRQVTRSSLRFPDKTSTKSSRSPRYAHLEPLKNTRIAARAPTRSSQGADTTQDKIIDQLKSKPVKHATRKNKTWTKEETLDLLKGVSMHGTGKWKEILDDRSLHFNQRSHIDLKDRYRVCREKKSDKKQKLNPPSSRVFAEQDSSAASAMVRLNSTPHAVKRGRGDAASKPSVGDLANLGIAEDAIVAMNVSRRERRAFTPAEDAAIHSGYAEHGAQWAKIIEHPALRHSRSRGDVRDRWRILSKRKQVSNEKTVSSEGKHEAGGSKQPMKLDRIIGADVEQTVSKDAGQMPTAPEQSLGFVNPAATWKPTNMFV